MIINLIEINSKNLGDFVHLCKGIAFLFLLVLHFSCSSIFFRENSIKNIKWGKDYAIDGEEISLSADVDESYDGVTFTIWKVSDDTASDKPFAVFEVRPLNGKAHTSWTYRWEDDPDSPLEEIPEFFFTVT